MRMKPLLIRLRQRVASLALPSCVQAENCALPPMRTSAGW